MGFDFSDSVFDKTINIPGSVKIVFVSDMFVEDYVGGAELTSQALIDSSPYEVFKLHSKDVDINVLQQGIDKFWIFGNFSQLNPQLIPAVVGNLKYSVLEYDYKYCSFRSPEKHMSQLGTPCDCHNQLYGKMISAFYFGSMGMWWMSEKQKDKYLTLFPFLAEKDNIVLSSVFDDKTLGTIKLMRTPKHDRKGWIVLGSNSWIKGCDDAKKWCEANKKEYEIVWNIPYEDVLAKLSVSEGFVYLPPGGDTCPRMVIEAKLLGCELHLNENAQHKDEEWFATDDIESIEGYLYASRAIFWNGIKRMMDYQPKISGYTTTYNAMSQGYPFEECIKSMLEFCDEVCVVDGGSTDGTWSHLQQLALAVMRPDPITGEAIQPLKIEQVIRDWSHPRFAVFDGMQKAEARAMCTKEFCWQMDSDEIVHEDDAPKISEMCRHIPKDIDILSLPVIEYWGGPDKVRVDVQPWKWRLSRNKPNITHGIPVELRVTDSDGNVHASGGTDGCDMIDKETGERIPHISFFTPEADKLRQVAMLGSEEARQQYEGWFNQAVEALPCVFHYSWYDLPRKIKLYKGYWTRHWESLFGKSQEDTAENNMMFDVPWSDVIDEMIEVRAKELSKLGGWIWHKKWDGKTITPWITCNRTQPKVMK